MFIVIDLVSLRRPYAPHIDFLGERVIMYLTYVQFVVYSQQLAHNLKATLYQRRNDTMSSHRR